MREARAPAKVLMIQGTGSDVGKSLMVAGLIRAFVNRGLTVRPFKPQNMSNNAAVTADGGEIGRAQALQALAARVAPSVHMNPVLLKPQSEVGSQVIVQGRIIGNAKAREFQGMKPGLMAAVADSLARMRDGADLVIVEGAGSAAEVNLRQGDIANMGFATAFDVPVILLGDIDRGGVIAQVVGTRAVLDPADAERIVGFIVNKFRGDASLFEDGMRLIERLSGWPALGLVPHFADAKLLPAEDAVALDRREAAGKGTVTIVVLVLPHIANFDDLDPLKAEPDVRLVMLRRGEPIPAGADLVIIPGSKATIADLAALRAAGWDIDLAAHIRRGGRVFGICGGYQMLGRSIADPEGMEGPPASVAGLGHLAVDTVLTGAKTLEAVSGEFLGGLTEAAGAPFCGYEMHIGQTEGPDRGRPVLRFAGGSDDGATSADGRVAGAYVHGLFADDAGRAAVLAQLGAASSGYAHAATVEATLDALAAHIGRHVDLDRLLALAR